MTDKLWEELNVEPPPKRQAPSDQMELALTPVSVKVEESKEENPVSDTAMAEDFEVARATMKTVLEKGGTALTDMAHFAKSDQSPRSYEVVATLIKTLSDTAKTLVDLHQTKMKIEQGPSQAAAYNTASKQRALEATTPSISVDKAVFIGNNRDLIAQLKGKNNDNDSDQN